MAQTADINVCLIYSSFQQDESGQAAHHWFGFFFSSSFVNLQLLLKQMARCVQKNNNDMSLDTKSCHAYDNALQSSFR